MGLIKESMAKAIEIGSEAKFKVKIYECDADDTKTFEEWTYITLGMYLMTNIRKIAQVHIILKPE